MSGTSRDYEPFPGATGEQSSTNIPGLMFTKGQTALASGESVMKSTFGLPLSTGLKNAFMNEKYSNLTVTSGDYSWKVHKLVLCSQSEFFRKVCDGDFVEAAEGKITLAEEDPHIIATVLHYMYHFEYNDRHYAAKGYNPIILNIEVAFAADKLFIEPLLSLALEKFKSNAKFGWTLSTFPEAVKVIYGNGGTASKLLRHIIMNEVQGHADRLFVHIDHAPFQKVASETPEFLMEYAQETAALQAATKAASRKLPEEDVKGTWYRCPVESCKKHDAVFRVGDSVPKDWRFNCPLRCTKNQGLDWWQHHVVNR